MSYMLKVILIIVLNLLGLFGSISPAVPGPPLSLIALTIAYFSFPGSISMAFLLFMLLLCLVATTIDYFAPSLVTKLGGGSKYAIWGSTLGVIIGFFLPPIGVLWVPLVGAFIGELINDFKFWKAAKVAFLSFLSFLLTTGFKLILCGVLAFVSIYACFS